MSFLDRPDKTDSRYSNADGFIRKTLYIEELESYCDLIEERLILTQESLDKLLLKIESVNKQSLI
jgi:hypothetical protein